MRQALPAAAPVLWPVAAHGCHAAPVSDHFGGVTDPASGSPRFSGELHCDDAAPHDLPGQAGFGVCEMGAGAARLSLAIGHAAPIVCDHVTVTIGNGNRPAGADQFAFTGQDEATGAYRGVLLEQAAGRLFDDDRLRLAPVLSRADFDLSPVFCLYQPATAGIHRTTTHETGTLP